MSRKSVSGSPLHGVCMGWSGTSVDAIFAVVNRSSYLLYAFLGFIVFGDFTHPVVPTLSGASGDVMTVYAYWDAKGRFFQSLALPRAGQSPCQRREMTS